jgi:serine/threonine-protein kinase
MSAHVVKAPPPLAESAPATPVALQEAIAHGLAKDMADRPTAEAFATMLEGSAAMATASVPARPAATGVTPAIATTRGRRATTLAVAAALVAVMAAGAWWATHRRAGVAMKSDASERPGLAVLPFERLGGTDDAYIAAGLTDELMGQLAEVPGLRVAARTTVRAYADSSLPPTQLGERLDVQALVEGSVQRLGDKVRVSTRLVDVRDGSTLWSQRYDRQMRDLFALQREIGGAVVTALTPRLGLSGQTGRSEAGTADADAYDLFLRARYALDQRGADSLRAAIALFTQATTRDPRFARAFAGIAEATALLPQYGSGGYPDHDAAVRAAAATALALDSALAAPHLALGLLAKGLGAWRDAEQEFNLALVRQPDYAPARQNLGELYYTLGRVDDAARALGAAATLEPANAPMVSEYAFALLLASRIDSARRVIDRAVALDPRNAFGHFTRALVLERQGDGAAAVAAMAQATARAPLPLFVGALARLAREAGDSATARSATRQLDAMRAAPGVALARMIAGSAWENPAVMSAGLDRAVAEHDPFIYQVPLRLWWFDRLRSTPALARVAQQLGLPPSAIAPLPAVARAR